MTSRRIVLWVCLGVLFLCGAEARADYWKHVRPGSPWMPVKNFSKDGAPFMEGQWQYECKISKTGDQFDNGGRYLAVFVHNAAWIHAECFYTGDPEKVARPRTDPVLLPPKDIFSPGQPAFQIQPIPSFRNGHADVGALWFEGNAGFCLDVPNGSLVDGARVQLFACQKSPNQRFALGWEGRGQIVAMPGTNGASGYPMCLDYYPGQGRDGDPVTLFPCHGLTGGQVDSQLWWPEGSHIRSGVTGRCISPAAVSAQTPLVLRTCPPRDGKPSPFALNIIRW